jgi:hypothetical protein
MDINNILHFSIRCELRIFASASAGNIGGDGFDFYVERLAFRKNLWCWFMESAPFIIAGGSIFTIFSRLPLRVIVGVATAFLLQMQGLDVWREGVCLHFGEKLIWIDAPCSGIKMLWFGFFLASFLFVFIASQTSKQRRF